MSVLNVWWPQAGLVPNTTQTNSANTLPTIVYIQTNDTLATVTTAGYLNKAAQLYGAGTFNNTQMALTYTSDEGLVWLKVVITFSGLTASYSLATPSSGSGEFSSLTLGDGTAAAPSLNFSGSTTTGLYEASANVLGIAVNGAAAASFSAAAFTMLGNVIAGASGTAGTLRSFPATAANGYFEIAATATGGARNGILTNATLAQTTTWTLPDPGAATATILLNTGTNTMAAGSRIVAAKGTGTASAGAVTVNTQAGTITSEALTTAGLATATITFTNSQISATSTILLTRSGGTDTVPVILGHEVPGAGSVVVNITNVTAATPLDGTVIFDFLVI